MNEFKISYRKLNFINLKYSTGRGVYLNETVWLGTLAVA